jgi:hypothetical protein
VRPSLRSGAQPFTESHQLKVVDVSDHKGGGGIARGVERQYALAEAARHLLDAAYLTGTGEAVMQFLTIHRTVLERR